MYICEENKTKRNGKYRISKFKSKNEPPTQILIKGQWKQI